MRGEAPVLLGFLFPLFFSFLKPGLSLHGKQDNCDHSLFCLTHKYLYLHYRDFKQFVRSSGELQQYLLPALSVFSPMQFPLF